MLPSDILNHPDPAERLARLRAMQSAVRTLAGLSGEATVAALRAAEHGGDPCLVETAMSALPSPSSCGASRNLRRPLP
jgi:hypothetical protein